MKKFKRLLREVLRISDNNNIYGRAKYNLMDRAIQEVINHASDTNFTKDEQTEAQTYMSLIQGEMGGQAYKLKPLATRIVLDLT